MEENLKPSTDNTKSKKNGRNHCRRTFTTKMLCKAAFIDEINPLLFEVNELNYREKEQ